VLIAEDDPLSASFLEQLLEEQFHCEVALNGRLAYEATRRENFVLALVDVMMPEMDGLELCRKLRAQERTARLPIIMVTARDETEDIVAGLEAGANDYVSKPVDAAVLEARIATQLRVARLQRQRDEVATMLTHDLKGSLTLVLSHASMLRHMIEIGRVNRLQATKHLNGIRSRVEDMTSMINNYLTLAKLEGGRFPFRPQWLDPSTLVETLFDALRDYANQKTIELSADLSEAPNEIYADEEGIGRALHNLMGNAIKFTPESGKARLIVCKADDRIEFIVEDTGPGIPEESIDRLFERFERFSQNSEEGSGLGLAIVKLVAEAHGGGVSAVNRPNGGAAISFWLPAKAAHSAPARK